MTTQMMRVVDTVRRNGFEIEVSELQPDSTGIRVLDLRRNAEAYFNFTRRSELAVAKKLCLFYCTAAQAEAILDSGGRKARPTADSAEAERV